MEKISEKIRKVAIEVGFDLVGFSPAKMEQKYIDAYVNWIKSGHHGDMTYMEKIEQRQDLTKILPGAKSVISLALNYHQPEGALKTGNGRIASYAVGRDYHKTIGSMLKQLAKKILEIKPDVALKYYVDTGPLLEKAIAEQAGIGRIGKNSLLITPEFGSWVFLAEIITDLDLVENGATINTSAVEKRWKNNQEKSFNVCGNCTKCIDACPTGAIVSPGVIDSKLCISYLTIEHRDKIAPELAEKIEELKLLYGCDICQQVCPHNQARQKITTQSDFLNFIAGDQQKLEPLAKLKSHGEMVKKFAGSATMRTKHTGMSRNAKIILNSGF